MAPVLIVLSFLLLGRAFFILYVRKRGTRVSAIITWMSALFVVKDATGAPMYQRGWRTEAGVAPIRETLASALLLWSGAAMQRGPITDPCCGAGTFVIEAAQIARRLYDESAAP